MILQMHLILNWKENEYYNGDQIKKFDVPINYKFLNISPKAGFDQILNQ